MHVAICGGGTGGHLVPGAVVASALRARGVEVGWICGDRPAEVSFVTRTGIPYIALPMRRRAAALRPGLWRGAVAALRGWGSGCAVGLGGYASLPGCLAARAMGLDLFLLEQNALPGRVNRLLSSLARATFLTHRTRWRLPRSRVTGAPLRDPPAPVEARGRAEGRWPCVLVLGGSLGSREVNSLFLDAAADLRRRFPGLLVRHQTGPADEARVRAAYGRIGIDADVFPSREGILADLAAADAVVARAGGNSLAEILAFGPPAVLLPLLSAADGHQEENARGAARAGAALVLGPAERGGDVLARALSGILADAERSGRMRRAARALARLDGTQAIVEGILRRAGAA